jgi:Ni,Fe-hydrogenase maturation factor
MLHMPLPQEVIVFAIEAKEVYTFTEECTPEVAQAIPRCIELILRELDS